MKHGGNLAEAKARFGGDDWLDLSTGINPVSYPCDAALVADAWHRLPQADRESQLLAVARDYYRVPDTARIVAAPGTQLLIQLAARLRQAERVAVVAPTYSEHAIAWRSEGAQVVFATDVSEAVSRADVVIAVNPNNPDGRVWPPGELLRHADALAARGGLLVIDEAFADVVPDISVCAELGRPGLLVLKSFGKFFGLAGVRLGFAIGHEDDIARISTWLGPWAVPGPAIEVGIAALGDHDWIAHARAGIDDRSERLCVRLRHSGMRVLGNAGLFVLATHPQAGEVWEHLARNAILVRSFDYAPDWLRFGLADDAGLARLDTALRSFASANGVSS